MNAGAIWWSQIGNSLRLLMNVTNTLQDCRSAVLQVPQRFPWRQDFYREIDLRRVAFSGEKQLKRLKWSENEKPGEFVLNELCSPGIRADYWPGQTHAKYLGSIEDILLNDYYVWISGIHSKADITNWLKFVDEYNQASKERENRAVFILEYDGAELEITGAEPIRYTVERHDCRVFCLEAAATLGNTPLREYQAEVALCMGAGDPELCAALLQVGLKLLQDPVKTAQSVIQSAFTSEGKTFDGKEEQQLTSAAWQAAVVLLFPQLEKYRLRIISGHEHALAKHLPITNSNGDRVTDPFDLELGAIQHIMGLASKDFANLEHDEVRLCRKVRNLLAHNKPVLYEDATRVLSLQE